MELTGTVDKNKMKPQLLDRMDLERERGITIKLAPVRMHWSPTSLINADDKKTADKRRFLYEDLTYKLRGALFNVYNNLGSGHKESVYSNSLEEELKKQNINFEKEKVIEIYYNNKKVGTYQPDFLIENKIIIELKAQSFIGKDAKKQTWNYLKGSKYRLAFLVNFGPKLDIKRIVFDEARDNQRQSAVSSNLHKSADSTYELNLIDTPGHVDFSYEVSRALRAVEGVVLLVDATKGIQAQTVANLKMAQELGLKIIPAINKIDVYGADIESVKKQISNLLNIDESEINLVSAKTGEGVEELLNKIIKDIPDPRESAFSSNPRESAMLSALIFDSIYDKYKGVIAYVRIFSGEIEQGKKILLYSQNQTAEATEVGYFAPEFKKNNILKSGEIGYIATNLKNLENVKIGDSLTLSPAEENFSAIKGFKEPTPMVFASFFPLVGEEINRLKDSLEKFRLSDSALKFEPEVSNTYGSGFKCSFLGLLHLEIVKERLKREFGQDLIVTTPSVSYKILKTDGTDKKIQKAEDMPDRSEIKTISEPWVKLEILSPSQYLSPIINLLTNKRGYLISTDNFDATHLNITAHLPLSSLIIDFYDGLKNATQGYASLNYEFLEYRVEKLAKLDILINGEPAQGLSRIVPYSEVRDTGAGVLVKLKTLIPRQMIAIALQAKVDGDIVARENISALRKDVTAKLYGGDVTRKNKLLKKQAKGKKKMKEIGKVQIPSDTYIKMLKI